MIFSEITGLEDLKATLINAVQTNHVAHALMFLGKEGSPNLAMALALSTYLVCESKGATDACGICAGCIKSRKFIHPDIQYIFPVSTNKKITKDPVSQLFLPDWRNFLQSNQYAGLSDWANFFGAENKQLSISREESRNIIKALTLKPFEANQKILMIWLPEQMHPTAANAILKILEEPPGQTIFMLVCNSNENILPTILSRTQLVHVRNFSDDELLNILENKYQVAQQKAAQLVALADGNLNHALKLNLDVEDDSHAMFREWMRFCYVRDFTNLVLWTEKYHVLNKEAQKIILHYGLTMFRECLIWNSDLQSMNRLHGENLDFVKNFSKVLIDADFSRLLQLFNDTLYHLERNANAKILFFDLSLQVAAIIRK